MFSRENQALQIAVAAADRTVDRADDAPAGVLDERSRCSECARDGVLVLDHSALADLFRTDLELRLEQRNQRAVRLRQRERGRQHFGETDKACITRHEIGRSGQMLRRQSPRILMFQGHDPAIFRETGRNLAGADINAGHARSAAGEQNVDETAGRCADIQAFEPRYIQTECIQRGVQLDACARDPRMSGFGVDDRVGVDFLCRLFEGLAVRDDPARLYGGGGLRARRKQAARNQNAVGPVAGSQVLARFVSAGMLAMRARRKEPVMKRILMLGAIGLGAACAAYPLDAVRSQDEAPAFEQLDDGRIRVPVIGTDGAQIGRAAVRGTPAQGVLLEVEIDAGGLAPGWHGLHLHQVGDCSDIGAFTNSGGHVGLIEGGHGFLNEAGPEAGDLPNIWAGEDGSAGGEFITDRLAVAAHAPALLDGDGTALIIHESRDDHASQPIGGAGARVACAAFPSLDELYP